MKQNFHEKYRDVLTRKIEHYSEAVNIYQIEDLANRNLSLQGYAYYSTGSLSHESLDENERAFKRYKILPRVLVDVSTFDTTTELLGEKIDMPICIAPTAMHKLAHFNGEIETAKAASELNTIICLSTMSNVSLSEVAQHATHKWMQLYVQKNLDITAKTIKMIEKAGYTALAVTVDAPVMGIRDVENFGKFEGPDKREETTHTHKVESGLGQFFSKTFNSVSNFFQFNLSFFLFLVNGLEYS
jgi:isopentenyl diphosphate isomerase/L-lactate dehydrogenase-like FMN-dependent dehydrogenase